jgi:tetratricopeptide (TPR) repeat protein
LGAIASCNQAIGIDPHYAEAYNGKGVIMYLSRQYKEAIKEFDQAIALQPQYAKAYYNRGLANQMRANYLPPWMIMTRPSNRNPITPKLTLAGAMYWENWEIGETKLRTTPWPLS